MGKDFDRLMYAAVRLHPSAGIDGPAALARFLDESAQTMTNWQSRGVPRAKIGHLAKRIGCRAEYLQFGDGDVCDSAARPPVVPDDVMQALSPAVRALIETAIDSAQSGDMSDDQAAALAQFISSTRKAQP